MNTIWRFETEVRGDDLTIAMPTGAQVLHARAAAFGGLTLTVWAVVDPTAPAEPRPFCIRGTGHPLGDVGTHIATSLDGPFVWHIFEGKR